MREIAEADHLRALPLCVTIRTKSGRTCERSESGGWTEMGKAAKAVTFDEEDFPAKVVWSYAEEIGDPATEALAQLAVVLLNAQQTKAQQLAVAQAEQQWAQEEQERQRQQIEQQFIQRNGQPPIVAPVGTPPVT
jgi:hypothetical protein